MAHNRVNEFILGVGQSQTVAVSTTVLRPFASTAWTSTNSTVTRDRTAIRITNHSATLDLCYAIVPRATNIATNVGLAGATVAGPNDGWIAPKGSDLVKVGEQVDIVLVRASSSTDKATCTELL